MTPMRRLTALAIALLATLVIAPVAGASNPLTAFTLVVPKATAASGLQARAILPTGARCPALSVTTEVDGARADRLIAMTARRAAPSTGTAFASIFVCQAAIPAGAVEASVGATTIPAALPATIKRVALLGDTGCRLKEGDPTQACSSASKWPIARVAASIERANPDVIMHIGDYFYREAACPSDMLARCGGSPAPVPGNSYKDTDYGWVADAIIPLSPLFAVAPIVMTRGNHEACFRGGNGWYLFFDPWAGSAQHCAPNAQGEVPDAVSKTWTADLPLGGMRTLHIAVVDSAYGYDAEISSWKDREAPLYKAAALESKAQPGRESWLITHRPLFGIQQWVPDNGGAPYNTWIAADQTAAALPNLDPFSLILGSHIHVAQANQIPGMPGQLVIGNSGTQLEPSDDFSLPAYGPLRSQETGAAMVPGMKLPGNATFTWSALRFGFVIATPGAEAGQWSFSQRSTNGVEFARCALAKRQIHCR
jgi:hypothetical protein